MAPFRHLSRRGRTGLLKVVLGGAFLVAAAPLAADTDPLPTEDTMDKSERRARQKLSGISQDHIFKYWSDLTDVQRGILVAQIDRLDVAAFRWQQEVLSRKDDGASDQIESFDDIAASGDAADIELGRRLLSQGKVGCIIVAGGQGTRLRIDGPKGKYPISVIKNKTLFQIFAEKTIAASKQAGRMLHLAVMTSPQNHQETTAFFAANNNFGLSPLQLHFFCQGDLPLLDSNGNLFLEEKYSLSIGPDGNGSCLKSFVESGIWEKWKNNGIEHINFVLIDNPLADPFDANLVGFHAARGDAATVKCVERVDPKEKVGVLIRKNGRVEVVEYTEISPDEQAAQRGDGTLRHRCANISLFCFGIDFVQDAAAATTGMALHPAFKAVKALGPDGQPSIPPQPNAWKFERFIFDVLPFTSQVSALIYPRERCFAPLKNFDGSDSPATVRAALQRLDRLVLEELTGFPAPGTPFELSQEFHYPTQAFKERWHGRALPVADYYDGD